MHNKIQIKPRKSNNLPRLKCKFCGSNKLRKNGFIPLKKIKKQKYQCKKCKNSFTLDSLGLKGSVRCAICKKLFLIIKHSHLSKHNITMKDYKKRFPRNKLISNKIRNNLLKQVKKYFSNPKNREKHSELRKRWYKENPEKVRRLQRNRMKTLKGKKFRNLQRKLQKERIKNNPKKWEIIKKKIQITMKNPKTREKISKSIREYWNENPLALKEREKKILKSIKSKKYRIKRSKLMKKYHKKNPKARRNQARKLSKWIRENPNKWKIATEKSAKTRRSSEFRKKTSNKVKKFLRDNPKFKKKLEERARNMWKDEKAVKKMIKTMKLKPNKSELKLIQICNEMCLPYRYVGDFKLMLNGRNPDFVNTNGKKKLIELFGKFWHTERIGNLTVKEHVKDRKEHFKKLGYDTLIIWHYELKYPEKVVEKINSFENR